MDVLALDVVQIVHDILTAGMQAQIVTRLPADNPAGSFITGMPYLRVVRIGGPDDGLVLDLPTLALHAFAKTEQQANGLLITAASVLRAAKGQIVDGAIVNHVRKLSGPTWVASDNQAVFHAVSMFQLRVKSA